MIVGCFNLTQNFLNRISLVALRWVRCSSLASMRKILPCSVPFPVHHTASTPLSPSKKVFTSPTQPCTSSSSFPTHPTAPAPICAKQTVISILAICSSKSYLVGGCPADVMTTGSSQRPVFDAIPKPLKTTHAQCAQVSLRSAS